MPFVKRSLNQLGELLALPETFLRGDALAGLQPDLSNKDRFEVLLNADLLKQRTPGDQEATALLHPGRHTHLRGMYHAPGQRLTVISAYKNASRNPLMLRHAPKLAALVFREGMVANDPLKRTSVTFSGRGGKAIGLVTLAGSPATQINLPGEWQHAEFTGTKEALFPFMPGGHRVYVASYEQVEQASLGKVNVRYDLAYESKLPIVWASQEIGQGFVLGFSSTTAPRAMSAQGFRPVRSGNGAIKLTPATQVIPTGSPGAEMLDGLTLSADGRELQVVLRDLSDHDREAPLPRMVPFKNGIDDAMRGIIESLGGLPQ